MRQTLDEQLMNDMTAALAVHPGVNLVIGAPEALCILSALQLALRHPAYKAGSKQSYVTVESFARALGERLGTSGPLAAAIEMGWNPAHDETNEEYADPEHREAVAAQVFAAAERSEAESQIGKPGFRIEAIYAFLAIDPDDDAEGVIGFLGPDGWLPMIGADEARIKSLRPIALDLAQRTAGPITLVKFSRRELLETIKA